MCVCVVAPRLSGQTDERTRIYEQLAGALTLSPWSVVLLSALMGVRLMQIRPAPHSGPIAARLIFIYSAPRPMRLQVTGGGTSLPAAVGRPT